MAIKLTQKQKFIELRAEGYSLDFIKIKIGISKPKLVAMDKELQEEIEEVISIKEDQFITELRTRNMDEVKILVNIRQKAYSELEKCNASEMNIKELLLFIRNIEDLISNKTNIEQFKNDLYKVRQEMSIRFEEYEKQIQVLNSIPKDRVVQLGVSPVRIDLITSIDGVEFRDAYPRIEKVRFGSTNANFISREDLIKNKSASNRKKDQADLEELQ